MNKIRCLASVSFLLVWNTVCAADTSTSSAPVIIPPTNTVLVADANGEFSIGPNFTDDPAITVKEGVPKGILHDFTMESTNSQFYPGISKKQPGTVPYHRRVCVYVPRQYVPGTAAPFIVVQDGLDYKARLPAILDNLISEHRLPVMIAVMVNSGGGNAQGSERGLEYDTISDKYTQFIETEVLPKIEKDYNLKFTSNPEGRATMGGSSGAACAFTMAWFHPELYRRVLSYSGTYVNQQSPFNAQFPHGASEYHEHLIPQNDAKPLRVWLEVGEQDLGYNGDRGADHIWPLANQRMAAVLKAKGYYYQFVYCRNAGHVDPKVLRQTLPEALEWLWQGYSTQ